jgi:adenylate cyclase
MTRLPKEEAGRKRRKPGLRLVLMLVVVTTVTLTALLVHLSWSYTAQRNVADVAGQLNSQITGSIRHELRGVLDAAWSVQEAVRSIFFQGTIAPTDEGKREFLFLSLLRSQPSLSWISLGFPNGGFFGAERLSDTEIDMVEVKRDRGSGQLRTDHYTPDAGDVIFRNREVVPTPYEATKQDWYSRAVAENEPGWSLASNFPNRQRPAIVTSTPLIVDGKFVGVVGVVIELERLSKFLAGLMVGKTGIALILDRDGHIVASPDTIARGEQAEGEMPMLRHVARKGSEPLRLIDQALENSDFDLAEVTGIRQIEIHSHENGKAYFVTFTPLHFRNWFVATVIPADDFLASIERAAQLLLAGLAILTLGLAAIATAAANRLIAAPLLRVAGQLKHIESFRLDRISRLPAPLREIDDLSGALLQMSRGLASFQKFMPADLVRTLVAQGVEARPGGQHQELTVMFGDMAGFTGLSEQLGEGIVDILTEFLETTSRIILAGNGTIDKFIGDAVMAFWGAPVANPRHAVEACAASLVCQRRLALQRQEARALGRMPIHMRIGINTGTVLVGNIGSNERLSYTVIGDPVNVASRLETLNKIYHTEIIIGEETRRVAGEAILVRRLDLVAVFGRMQGQAIYELLGLAGEFARPAWVDAYEAGLDAYENRRWQEAIRYFEAAREGRGGIDRPSELLLERCRSHLLAPPPPAWSPVWILDTK